MERKKKRWNGIFVLWVCCQIHSTGVIRCWKAGPLNAYEILGARHDCDYAGTNMLFKMSYYELMLPY